MQPQGAKPGLKPSSQMQVQNLFLLDTMLKKKWEDRKKIKDNKEIESNA